MKERERVRIALWESLTAEQRTLVRDGEKLDDLYRCGLKLIQQPRYFCVGSDAVLLADFTRPRAGERILEAGCGNGALLMLLYVKCPQARYVGVEVMENSADLAYRNLRLNGLTETLRVVRADFRTWAPEHGPFDQIVCNPPYFPRGTCRVSKVPERAAARFEMNGTLTEFFAAAAAALTPRGCFSLVVPAVRRQEVLAAAEAARLFCQRQRPVLNLREEAPLLDLWAFTPHQETETVLLPPICISRADLVCKQHWPPVEEAESSF